MEPYFVITPNGKALWMAAVVNWTTNKHHSPPGACDFVRTAESSAAANTTLHYSCTYTSAWDGEKILCLRPAQSELISSRERGAAFIGKRWHAACIPSRINTHQREREPFTILGLWLIRLMVALHLPTGQGTNKRQDASNHDINAAAVWSICISYGWNVICIRSSEIFAIELVLISFGALFIHVNCCKMNLLSKLAQRVALAQLQKAVCSTQR